MNERDLFIDSLQIADPDARHAFVVQACGERLELRERVLALLKSHDQLGDFLQSEIPPLDEPDQDGPGSVVGPYTIVKQIGEGGFGVVYLASQFAPLQRTVALKVLKPGMDSRQVKARFAVERQALALMDHPNIARVLDVGSTDSGRSFIAMEFVDGMAITKYCDEHRMPLRQRLELFLPICLAVQHAHQKGIIHRDLKPSNVMVGLSDARPIAKIIDFGVAKALGAQLTDHSLNTEFGSVIGTLQYMSPEQAELNAVDVDTHSDIYSLGVLLYELLTGSTPLDQARATNTPLLELLRIIREEEPLRPSDYLQRLDQREMISAQRSSDTHQLIRQMRGDLDWVVMQCLEKQRDRRYATAHDLAQDVNRFLTDQPVFARPPSLPYRLSKFVKRHRGSVIAGCLVVAAVVAGAIGTVWQAVSATRERDLANQERTRADQNFLSARDAVDRMFTRVAGELRDIPHTEQVRRKILEDALEYYENWRVHQSRDPSLRLETARAHLRVAGIYEMLSRGQQAENAYREAIGLLESMTAEKPQQAEYAQELAQGCTGLAYRLALENRADEMLEYFERALAIREKLAVDFPDEPNYQIHLSLCRTEFGNSLKPIYPQNAERLLRESVAALDQLRLARPADGVDKGTLAHCQQWLGIFLLQVYGSYDEAERYLRQALQLRQELLLESPSHADLRGSVSQAQGYLAELLWRTQRAGEAESVFRNALASREDLRDEFPTVAEHRRQVARLWEGLSSTLWAQGLSADAEIALARTIEIREQLVLEFKEAPPDPNELAAAHYQIGKIQFLAGRIDDAEKSFKRSFELVEVQAAASPIAFPVQQLLAEMLADCPLEPLRDPSRAIHLAELALKNGRTSGGYWRWSPLAGGQFYILALAQAASGRFQDAAKNFERSIELCPGEDGRRMLKLAIVNTRLKNSDEARRWRDRAMNWMHQNGRSDLDLQLLLRDVGS